MDKSSMHSPSQRTSTSRLLIPLALVATMLAGLAVALLLRADPAELTNPAAINSPAPSISDDTAQTGLPHASGLPGTPQLPTPVADSSASKAGAVPLPGISTSTGNPVPAIQAGQCTNSDGTPCPASYFTGPLGKNNIVPSSKGALLMDRYGGQGVSWQQTQQGIIAREKAMGRRFDAIQFQTNAEDPTATRGQEQWLIERGYDFLTIAWNPSYDIAAINHGDFDALFVHAARYWKQFAPTRIMVRTFTEFNLQQHLVANSCGRPFQQAWQRMTRIFANQGATNVGFWYNPDEGNNRQCVIDSYPGDRYVDWVGSDSYNWCRVGDMSCYSTPSHPGPATFKELFNYSHDRCPAGPCPKSQHDIFGPRKPFVIGETGTIFDKDNSAFKQQFLDSVIPGAHSMKYLRGVTFFDSDVTAAEGPLTNFRVDAPTYQSQHLAAFVRLGQNRWFNVRKS